MTWTEDWVTVDRVGERRKPPLFKEVAIKIACVIRSHETNIFMRSLMYHWWISQGRISSEFYLPVSFFKKFLWISWSLITLQYCSGFCHTLKWISHGFTCIPHPDHLSHLPLHPIPLGLPSAPSPSTCLMHPTWAGDLFHPW